jgi:hypothetical protein
MLHILQSDTGIELIMAKNKSNEVFNAGTESYSDEVFHASLHRCLLHSKQKGSVESTAGFLMMVENTMYWTLRG